MYNTLAWRHDHPRSELNFSKVESRAEAEFLMLDPRVVNRA
jgi:hypothetical protein